MSETTREVEHVIEVAAPAESVYRLIEDVANWPNLFPPTVHVEHVERDRNAERIRIWAMANGEPKTWVSRRTLTPDGLRVEFAQEVSSPPVAAMGGSWTIEPTGEGTCRVRLGHRYRAIDDDPGGLAWLDQAVDRNSRSELAALKNGAELAGDAGSGLLGSFEDTVQVGGSAEHVYDFLNEARRWKDRLPHVARVVLREDSPGLQVLEMDTRTKDGSAHSTESVRVCIPHRQISYKQTTLPALLSLHTGAWIITPDGAGGVLVTSRHTVVINTDNLAKVLGDDATVPDAQAFVRAALSGNSLVTLRHAKEYAEARRQDPAGLDLQRG